MSRQHEREYWFKTYCPGCFIPNWFCEGDITDMTEFSPEAGQCYSCGYCWFFMDDYDIHMLYGENVSPSDLAELGNKCPR